MAFYLPIFLPSALEKGERPWLDSLPDKCYIISEDWVAVICWVSWEEVKGGKNMCCGGLQWEWRVNLGAKATSREVCQALAGAAPRSGSSQRPMRALIPPLTRSLVWRMCPLLRMVKSRKNESYVWSAYEVILSGSHWKHLHLQP